MSQLSLWRYWCEMTDKCCFNCFKYQRYILYCTTVLVNSPLKLWYGFHVHRLAETLTPSPTSPQFKLHLASAARSRDRRALISRSALPNTLCLRTLCRNRICWRDVCICIAASVTRVGFFAHQLWIDNAGNTPGPAPEKKEADFFDEHTQVGRTESRPESRSGKDRSLMLFESIKRNHCLTSVWSAGWQQLGHGLSITLRAERSGHSFSSAGAGQ